MKFKEKISTLISEISSLLRFNFNNPKFLILLFLIFFLPLLYFSPKKGILLFLTFLLLVITQKTAPDLGKYVQGFIGIIGLFCWITTIPLETSRILINSTLSATNYLISNPILFFPFFLGGSGYLFWQRAKNSEVISSIREVINSLKGGKSNDTTGNSTMREELKVMKEYIDAKNLLLEDKMRGVVEGLLEQITGIDSSLGEVVKRMPKITGLQVTIGSPSLEVLGEVRKVDLEKERFPDQVLLVMEEEREINLIRNNVIDVSPIAVIIERPQEVVNAEVADRGVEVGVAAGIEEGIRVNSVRIPENLGEAVFKEREEKRNDIFSSLNLGKISLEEKKELTEMISKKEEITKELGLIEKNNSFYSDSFSKLGKSLVFTTTFLFALEAIKSSGKNSIVIDATYSLVRTLVDSKIGLVILPVIGYQITTAVEENISSIKESIKEKVKKIYQEAGEKFKKAIQLKTELRIKKSRTLNYIKEIAETVAAPEEKKERRNARKVFFHEKPLALEYYNPVELERRNQVEALRAAEFAKEKAKELAAAPTLKVKALEDYVKTFSVS